MVIGCSSLPLKAAAVMYAAIVLIMQPYGLASQSRLLLFEEDAASARMGCWSSWCWAGRTSVVCGLALQNGSLDSCLNEGMRIRAGPTSPTRTTTSGSMAAMRHALQVLRKPGSVGSLVYGPVPAPSDS